MGVPQGVQGTSQVENIGVQKCEGSHEGMDTVCFAMHAFDQP